MCEPVSLSAMAAGIASSVSAAGAAVAGASTATLLAASSLAVGVGGAAASYVQGQSQAKAASRSAQENYVQQTEALKLQYDQTNKQATDQMSIRAREAKIETARLRVLGGESGLAGGSNDRIEDESQFNLGTDIASLESSRRNNLNQLYQEGKSGRAGNQSLVNTIKRPSLIGTGLQIADAGVNAATTQKYISGKLNK